VLCSILKYVVHPISQVLRFLLLSLHNASKSLELRLIIIVTFNFSQLLDHFICSRFEKTTAKFLHCYKLAVERLVESVQRMNKNRLVSFNCLNEAVASSMREENFSLRMC